MLENDLVLVQPKRMRHVLTFFNELKIILDTCQWYNYITSVSENVLVLVEPKRMRHVLNEKDEPRR